MEPAQRAPPERHLSATALVITQDLPTLAQVSVSDPTGSTSFYDTNHKNVLFHDDEMPGFLLAFSICKVVFF